MKGWVGYLAGTLGGMLACASTPRPEPLHAVATALSLAAIALTEASRAQELGIAADYRARLDRCPVAPAEREACKALARAATLEATRARTEALHAAVALQHRAADLAEEADRCRRQVQGCAEAKEREAKALLDELRGLLSGLQGGKTP